MFCGRKAKVHEFWFRSKHDDVFWLFEIVSNERKKEPKYVTISFLVLFVAASESNPLPLNSLIHQLPPWLLHGNELSQDNSDASDETRRVLGESPIQSSGIEESILYLQITVVHTICVTVHHSIGDLAKDRLDGHNVANESSSFGNVEEKVSLRSTVKDHVKTAVVFDHLVQCHHVGVSRHCCMQLHLVALEDALSWVEAVLVQALDSVDLASMGVDSPEDRSIGPYAEHVPQDQPAAVDGQGQLCDGSGRWRRGTHMVESRRCR